jgi:hypothetical protein
VIREVLILVTGLLIGLQMMGGYPAKVRACENEVVALEKELTILRTEIKKEIESLIKTFDDAGL